mgnify:FL=1
MATQEIKDADMRDAVNYIDLLYDRGLIKKTTFDRFLNGEGLPSKFSLNNAEKQLIREIVEIKQEKKIALNELEVMYKKRDAAIQGKKVYDRDETESEYLDRTAPIVHAPLYTNNSERRLFGEDTWKTIQTITLDLMNARPHSRALNNALTKEALIPKEVGILRLTLTSIHQPDDLKSRQELLDDDDDDVRENARYLVEKVYDVFRLQSVEYIVKDTFGFRPHMERRPEFRRGGNPKAEKPRISGYIRPKQPLQGRLPEGGPPAHVDIRANSIKYYVKRQVAMLEEMMKNG